MHIVLAHTNTDFDSLASQFAVTKLYPGTRMVAGHALSGNLREFLTLHRQWLPVVDVDYADMDKITHVFIVDCQQEHRLEEGARKLITQRGLPYTVFDHHPRDPNGLANKASPDSIIRPVGACTTILVNKLMEQKATLTLMEATLLAIGIYEDTGCLTYGGTTAADAAAVAYLLSQGADLGQVTAFINPKLSDEQTELFQTLVTNAVSFTVSGARLLVSGAECSGYVGGLATLTRRLLDVVSGDAAVTVVKMRDRVYIVGRSDSRSVDIRRLIREFGGDGHPGAASAVVKGQSYIDLQAQVIELLKQQVPREIPARQIMRAPVRTIKPDMTMEEASRLMLRYDEDGLVVVDGGELSGVVSKRDVDKALHHKLGHAPVKGFMSRPVISARPDTPLSEIHKTMVQEDIGRLPVVDEAGELVGIVSRRELLRTVYGASLAGAGNGSSVPHHLRHMRFESHLQSLPPSLRWLFDEVGKTAAQLGMNAYAVGGCVRDLFLGSRTFDLDFVIEGSAIAVARALETQFPGRFQLAAEHERFQTATVTYFAEQKREVDLSTARIEFYEHPAALPTVEASILERDLFRRDFTINALAVCVNPDRYGDLVDFFDGVFDMQHKLIRVLHKFSFIEDPTRIIRAARFASRLNFELEPGTRHQAERAISMGVFDNLGGFRLKGELKIILESPQRLKAMQVLDELGGGLRYLATDLVYDRTVRSAMRRAQRLLARNPLPDEWIVYLGTLLGSLRQEKLESTMQRLALANDEMEWLRDGFSLLDALESRQSNGQPPASEIDRWLHGYSQHALAIAAALAAPGSRTRRWIKLYTDELKHVRVSVTGDDLMALGFPRAPVLKEALLGLREARLDGAVRSADDELHWLRQHYPQYMQLPSRSHHQAATPDTRL